MPYETLDYQVADHVLTLTLNRPDRLNAFNGPMMNELIAAFDAADADDDVRAIIVTGAGRAFCAGADLSAGAKTFDYEARDDRPDRQQVPRDPEGRIAWGDESVRDGGGRGLPPGQVKGRRHRPGRTGRIGRRRHDRIPEQHHAHRHPPADAQHQKTKRRRIRSRRAIEPGCDHRSAGLSGSAGASGSLARWSVLSQITAPDRSIRQ